jgi:hypothetical protein
LVPGDDRRAVGLVNADDLTGFLSAQPPAAILVGYEDILEQPLVSYAEGSGYQPVELSTGKTLWLLP